MTRLCATCAIRFRKELDIREKQWRLGICPKCQRAGQLLWPVLEPGTAAQKAEQAKPTAVPNFSPEA